MLRPGDQQGAEGRHAERHRPLGVSKVRHALDARDASGNFGSIGRDCRSPLDAKAVLRSNEAFPIVAQVCYNRAMRWCEWCGADFKPPRPESRMCSRKCSREYALSQRRKLPAVTIVERMYTVENVSLEGIGRRYGVTRQAVFQLLERAGIERREYTRKKVA